MPHHHFPTPVQSEQSEFGYFVVIHGCHLHLLLTLVYTWYLDKYAQVLYETHWCFFFFFTLYRPVGKQFQLDGSGSLLISPKFGPHSRCYEWSKKMSLAFFTYKFTLISLEPWCTITFRFVYGNFDVCNIVCVMILLRTSVFFFFHWMSAVNAFFFFFKFASFFFLFTNHSYLPYETQKHREQ